MLFLPSLFAGQCQTAQKGRMWLYLLSLENLSILSVSSLFPEKFSTMDAVVGLVSGEMVSYRGEFCHSDIFYHLETLAR